MESGAPRTEPRELSERIAAALRCNDVMVALARSDEDLGWEQLADVLNERQGALEAVFALPITGEDVAKVQAMGASVRQTDAELHDLLEKKKTALLDQMSALNNRGQAGRAYLDNDQLLD